MESPIKKTRIDVKEPKVIYLDYNATTPVAKSVVNIISKTLSSPWQNPSSSYHGGVEAKKIITESRKRISDMLNGSNGDVIFMSGGTEANNNIVYNALEYFKEYLEANKTCSYRKPHVITSIIEHDSILNVLTHFEKNDWIDVTYLDVAKELGHVSVDSLLQNIRDETVLITIMMANNETGAIQPIEDIAQRIDSVRSFRESQSLPKLFFHTDAAQSIGKISVNVEELGVDYLTVVGHKFYGPRIGALWVRSGCPFYPMFHGGGQENGKRAGTENTAMIAGLGEAAWLVTENLVSYNRHLLEVKTLLKEQLLEAFGKTKVAFNGDLCETLPNTLSISLVGDGLTGRKVLQECEYLQASVGAACHTDRGDIPSSILLAHGVNESVARNAIRLSVGRETSIEDIVIVVLDLKQAVKRVTDMFTRSLADPVLIRAS